MKRLKAFTLVEITVSMILMGIVIMIAITAYQFTGGQFQVAEEHAEKTYELEQLHFRLQNDILKAGLVKGRTNGLNLSFENGKEVSYTFSGQGISRREGNMSETYPYQVLNNTYLFKGEEVYGSSLAEQVIFELETEFGPINMAFEKKYSAADLLANENDYR